MLIFLKPLQTFPSRLFCDFCLSCAILELSQRQRRGATAELTDDDLKFAEGKEEELLGRLQQRLGKSPEEIHKEIELIEGPEIIQEPPRR